MCIDEDDGYVVLIEKSSKCNSSEIMLQRDKNGPKIGFKEEE